MTMAYWFEDLTKTMADDRLSRRQAIRRVAGGVTGMALASWLPGQVLAKDIPWNKQCPGHTDCRSSPNCNGNPNTNCFCFSHITGKKDVCGCDSFCSQL